MKKNYLLVCPGEKEKWKEYSEVFIIVEMEGIDAGKGFLMP
jgi:hypothetical protein